MTQFQQKFIEDATELLSDLESVLLELEQNPEKREAIEEVYRVMHTLKGVSSMFGFPKISEFTHHLENIYDYILEGKLIINTKILNVTFLSVDLLRTMLKDKTMEDKLAIKNFEILLARIIEISGQLKDIPDHSDDKQKVAVTEKIVVPQKDVKTFYILFRPYTDLFFRGVNPFSLLDELREIGKCIIIPHIANIPPITELEEDKCLVYWEIYLATPYDYNKIQDVFIFVPDEFKVHKLFDRDLLGNKEFVQKVEDQKRYQESIDFLDLVDFVNKIKFEEIEIVVPVKEQKIEFIKEDKQTIEEPEPESPEQSAMAAIAEQKIFTVKVSSEKLDDLMNLVSELVTTQAELSLISQQTEIERLTEIAETIEKLSRQLRDNAFSIRLVPINEIMVRMKRLVRDLSAELGKEVNFIIEGLETEFDKTIINNLSNPLVHILRNCIDHGIETPEVRVKKGKEREGTIHFKAFHSGVNVVIQIIDDGAGIDPKKILDKAIKKKLVSPDAQLTDKEIIELIFLPGFSTAEKVTEVSGRGVGMDVVKKSITNIRGQVDIDSEVGMGTKITIKLPITLSIVDALLVKIDSQHYLIPLIQIHSCEDILHEEIASNTSQRVVINGELVPFIYLRKEFEIQTPAPETEKVVVVNYDNMRVGLVVDSIIGEYQAVLKPLGEIYNLIQNIVSGASILGDGNVALIIDPYLLIRQFLEKNKIA